jgi:DNA-binding NarL/FixJ family response regulator
VGTRVLIVDDHAGYRRAARRLLEASGYAVVGEAPDGAAALAAVAELQPEVVLLDILLPDTNGFVVADAIASQPHPPIVVLTSSRTAADYGAALDGRRFVAKSGLTPARIGAVLAESR